ncbi:MAG: hypothetical protein ACPLUL_12765 [Thermanaerothrix sp.]|uniref:hypothetical protein n=1 Tax=Thermanaerothrix sp. TaxID=2972675 RepID=UPI003C7B997F
MQQVLLLILVGILGFLLGALVVWLWGERERRSAAAGEPTAPPSKTETASSTAAPSRQPPFSDASHVFVTRLWRDRSTGQLLVEVDGMLHATPDTLTDEQRQRLCTAAETWSLWLGLHSPNPPVSPPPPAPPSVFTVPIETLITPPAEPPREGSIVEQIDAILQELLATSPYADRRVRLVEEPQHGVVVWVGLERYGSIDDVPDEGIRALIQEAVRRWEG